MANQNDIFTPEPAHQRFEIVIECANPKLFRKARIPMAPEVEGIDGSIRRDLAGEVIPPVSVCAASMEQYDGRRRL